MEVCHSFNFFEGGVEGTREILDLTLILRHQYWERGGGRIWATL